MWDEEHQSQVPSRKVANARHQPQTSRYHYVGCEHCCCTCNSVLGVQGQAHCLHVQYQDLAFFVALNTASVDPCFWKGQFAYCYHKSSMLFCSQFTICISGSKVLLEMYDFQSHNLLLSDATATRLSDLSLCLSCLRIDCSCKLHLVDLLLQFSLRPDSNATRHLLLRFCYVLTSKNIRAVL